MCVHVPWYDMVVIYLEGKKVFLDSTFLPSTHTCCNKEAKNEFLWQSENPLVHVTLLGRVNNSEIIPSTDCSLSQWLQYQVPDLILHLQSLSSSCNKQSRRRALEKLIPHIHLKMTLNLIFSIKKIAFSSPSLTRAAD